MSLSTLHRHKRQYFNESTRVWRKKSDVMSDSGDDQDAGDDPSGWCYPCSDESLSDRSTYGRFGSKYISYK